MENNEEENLLDGWEERFDTTHGRTFYVHPERRIAQLEDPRISGLQTRQYGKDWINVIESNSPLDYFPWFHGNITKAETEELLKCQNDGTFLVRISQSQPDWFVLAVRHSTHSRNVCQFHIKHTDGIYTISQDGPFFNNIPKLVEYYTNHNDLSCGKLRAPLDKFEMKEEIDDQSTIPDELAHDPRTKELYEKALKEGTEKDSNIRIMVIGCYGQGKTSLVRRLLKESIEDVETTNGIDLHKCTMVNDVEWKKMDTEDIEGETVQRLVNIALNDSPYETASQVSETEKFRIGRETPRSLCENRISKDVSKFVDDNNLIFIDKSDDYKRKRNRKSTERQFSDSADTSESKQNISYQDFNLFKTELERIESVEEEISTHNSVTLNMWDFGGQFVYYATHQIFHSKQAVYILVFNLSIGLDTVIDDEEFPLHTKTMRDYLKFWVTSVNSFVGSNDGTEPAIVLVGTHMDKLKVDSNPDNYFEKVRQLFDGSICLNHIQSEHFAISTTSGSEKEIDRLRSYLSNLGQKQLETRIPAKWILLEKGLKTIKQKRIISLDELLQMDSQTDSPIQTDNNNKEEYMEQVKLFLSYHHAKGTFCYFDENNLADHVVLDPQFLIDAFMSIITSEHFCKVRPQMRSVWKELCNTAILRPALFDEVWKQESNTDFYKFRSLLIEYMQKHYMIAEVLAYDNESEDVVEGLGYFIVPSLLKVSANDGTLESFLKGKPMSCVSLCYLLKYETILPFIFQTCLAALIGRWPLIKFKDVNILYDNAASFEIERGHAGILMMSQNKLELLVASLCPPDKVKANVCDMFRRYVELVMTRNMHKLHADKDDIQFIKHIDVRCMHQEHGTKGSIETSKFENELSGNVKIPCPDKASHCIKLHDILREWLKQDTELDNVPKRKLTNKEYSTLSMAIGKGWQLLGAQLGLESVTIEHICMDKDTTAIRIYEMLLTWDKKEGELATLDILVKAIQNCDPECFRVNWDVLKNLIDEF